MNKQSQVDAGLKVCGQLDTNEKSSAETKTCHGTNHPIEVDTSNCAAAATATASMKGKRFKSIPYEGKEKPTNEAAEAVTGNPRVRFNIGGTKYEVSQSVIDQFPHSMLAKISSDRWRKAQNRKNNSEIYIERNGERFQYILDYMRDGSVQLPLSVPRGQLVMDLEYYGIDYADESITLSVADPKDLFHSLERYKDYFESLEKTVETSFKAAAARKVAFVVAKEFFGVVCAGELGQQPSYHPPRSLTYFHAQTIHVRLPHLSKVYLTTADLQPHFKAVGLCLANGSFICDASSHTAFVVSLLKPSS